MPERASTIGNLWQDHLNLIPFTQIFSYWHDKLPSPANLFAYMKSFSLWQLLFNILLTVPFGVYLHYYFKLSLKRTVLFSFLLSLFYETSQNTALFGIYPGPYRLADVEDLITNTMGGALGYMIAYVFVKILPDKESIHAQCRIAGSRVTGKRRIWASIFDWASALLLYFFLRGVILLLLPDSSRFFTDYGTEYFWTFFCLLSLAQVLLTGGATLGH